MSTQSQNNKRLAKNTFVLYMRMIFLMLISLYTSRVVLNALGVEDYGIYNVVGGFVSMFAILSGSLSSAISRFITFELGKKDFDRLKKVFSASVTIQILLSLIIIVLIETIGVWFLNNYMTIPQGRMRAANIVLQLSVITFVVNLISIPYNACIIAHEKMTAFAYISILDGVGKLLVAFLISHNPIDRLVFYAILLVIIAVITRVVYGIYCNRYFVECKYRFTWDKHLLYEMFNFAGWNFIGSSAGILRDQGGNIILNIFFGPTLNAAKGISNQVSHAVSSFTDSFMMAINPQIIKNYASENKQYMMQLIFQGARFSYYLLFILSLPIILNTHYILVLWLKLLPDHAVTFVQLTLILAISESLCRPLVTAAQATGKIRNYQLVVGLLHMANLPISYICLKLGYEPEFVLYVALLMSQICLGARLFMLRGMIGLPSRKFMRDVYLNVVLVTCVSLVIPILVSQMLSENFLNFVIVTLVSLLCSSLSITYIGLNGNERGLFFKYILSKCKFHV